MRIAIVGPGAMGCLLAALLKEANHDVWLIDRSPVRANQFSQKGICVDGIGGRRSVQVNATSTQGEIKAVDLVFIWVKSYDSRAAARSIAPLLNDQTQVITLQNGLGNVEAVAEVVRAENIMGGTTAHGATLMSEGCVRYTGKGETTIGRVDKCIDPKLEEAARLLSDAGIETHVTQDVEGAIWSKLIINAAINPITAITHLRNGEMAENPETRRVMDLVAEEAIEIVGRAGIALAYSDARARIYAVCAATAQNQSSMLQDVLQNRRTEIDAINGALVEKARALGIAAPVNETLTCLIRAIEGSSENA